MGCSGAGLRGSMAEAAEMGRLALVEIGRPQRQSSWGRSGGCDPRTEVRARRGDRGGRPAPGAEPYRPGPDRRVSDLPAPGRAGPGQAVFRRTPAAAPPRDQRSDRRGCAQVDLRSRLLADDFLEQDAARPPVAGLEPGDVALRISAEDDLAHG